MDKEFIKEVEYKREKEATAEMRIIIKELLHARDKALLEAVVKEIAKEYDNADWDYKCGLGKAISILNHIFREITSVIDKIKEADNNPEQGKGEK